MAKLVVTSSERLVPLQALTYFCIYVVRQGVTSWFVFYLMKVRHKLAAVQGPSNFGVHTD